jgi:hypothetical protein
MNSNYTIVVKKDLDKLLLAKFIQPINKATQLSSILIILKKKKLRMHIDFHKLTSIMKKDPYSFLLSKVFWMQ